MNQPSPVLNPRQELDLLQSALNLLGQLKLDREENALRSQADRALVAVSNSLGTKYKLSLQAAASKTETPSEAKKLSKLERKLLRKKAREGDKVSEPQVNGAAQ